MGIGFLTPDERDDLSILLTTADTIAARWHLKGEGYGFKVSVNHNSAIRACDLGRRLFSTQFFPEQPGSFKRVAAFLVIGRLYPFFEFSGEKMPAEAKHGWLSRLMALSIPMMLCQMKADLHHGSEPWTILNKWKKFPSKHYKLEFLAWLKWLDCMERYKTALATDWQEVHIRRLARMVMACSLIIEAAYYLNQSEIPSDGLQHHSGNCLSKPLTADQMLDLSYHERLMEN